ncbi:MAG: pilus assembly protein [Pirellulaceae bacterium]|nr:pilus assembly protein [Pirellulaceae bacterium]
MLHENSQMSIQQQEPVRAVGPYKSLRGVCRDMFRRGAATIETAVTLPVLVLLVFGSIEIANGVFLKQTLTVAAYEGARVATRPGATRAQARQRVQEILAARNVNNRTITISPAVDANTSRGTRVTVTVSSNGSSQSFNPLGLFMQRTLTKSAIMVRL